MTETLLPISTITSQPDGTLSVSVRLRGDERKKVRSWFERLASFNWSWALLPSRIKSVPAGMELEFAPESRQAATLSAKVAEWGQDLPASLPAILGLGRFTLTVSAEFARVKEPMPPLSPALVRFLPGTLSPWRFMPLPGTTGATGSLAEWAKSDPDAWLWLSPRTLLEGADHDPVHTLGAALHHGLVGSLFPDALSRREVHRRLLRGRIGMGNRLEASVRGAMPQAFEEEAALLSALILDCLSSREGQRPNLASAQKRFESLERKLDLDRLIAQWQKENRNEIAGKLAAQGYPVPQPPPPEGPDMPGTGKGWSDIAKAKLGQGDLNGALDAAWKAIHSEGPVFIHLYLSIVQAIAVRSPSNLSQANAAIQQLVSGFKPMIAEAEFLHIAHLRMRYLQVSEQDLGPLDWTYESRWNDGVAHLMQARLHILRGTEYNVVSRLCREGLKRFQAMPQGGGPAGEYAQAYLHLLDGIAHIGHVSLTRQDAFYTDALERFMNSYRLATKAGAADLIHATLRWLARLAQLTRFYPDSSLSLVHAGAQAILQSHGVHSDLALQEMPEIPWYDDAILFPL